MKPWIKALISCILLALLGIFLPWGQVRDALGRLSPAVWVGVLGVAGHALAAKRRLFVNAAGAGLARTNAAPAAGLFANPACRASWGATCSGWAGRQADPRPKAALWAGR